MLIGRFGNTSGRPYFEGRLSIPRLNVVADISFIFDTGADTSLLMPLDSRRMGIDFGELASTADSCGIGGLSKQFVEPAILAFTEAKVCLHLYFLQLRIAAQTPDINTIPSLLGRDIIDHWAITYDKSNAGLTAEINYSDMQFPINGSATSLSPNPNTPPAQAPD